MNYVLCVLNSNAGRKKAVMHKKELQKFLIKNTKSYKFVQIDEFETTNLNDYDTIIAVGGDGTINKVIPKIIGTDKTLVIIPCGTANLLSAKLGIPNNLSKNLELIKSNNIKKIDIIDINNHLCALRCGWGYDSDIISKTPQKLKNNFGYFAYFIAGILFALRLKKKNYKINIDGTIHNIDASCLIFANAANMYRKFVTLANGSNLEDGLIDIFILKTCNPLIFLFELILIILHIRRDSSRAEYLKGKTIYIENKFGTCHIDGEKTKLAEDINVKIIPKAINVYCKEKLN